MTAKDVIWLRPRYTQRPNFHFACRVLHFDASRRGHAVRQPQIEFSTWEPETHTFTLADERGEIARMSFLRRTIRWKLCDGPVPAGKTQEPSGR